MRKAMYTISKQFSFEASHQLEGLPANPDGTPHKCTQLHGHSYRVELVLSAPELNTHSFVVDYNELNVFGAFLADTFDHHHLNDILSSPTAEHIAQYLYDWAKKRWPEVTAVKVSETPKTWAVYER
jgi:6-pyruvoyltetrahydropterin/6-carboxytetrahydropterin synthase